MVLYTEFFTLSRNFMNFKYIIIGAGSGGVRLARLLGGSGNSVAIIEKKKIGGTCVNVGCVPKKLFYYSSQLAQYLNLGKFYGWDYKNINFSWERLKANKDAEIARLNKIYIDLLKSNNVKIFKGLAKFVDKNRVEVNGEIISANNIIIATGGRSVQASFEGAKHVLYSDDLFALKSLPKKIFIVGSGYIAIEFACILNGLGVDVSLICRSSRLLSNFDYSSVDFLVEKMLAQGIKVHFSTTIKKLEKDKKGLKVNLTGQYKQTNFSDLVLCAIGRQPDFSQLGIDRLNLTLDKKGFVIVNEFFQTRHKNIYAIGDIVSGSNQLTPVALKHGEYLANYFLGKVKKGFSKIAFLPTAIFSKPTFSSVGFSEEELLKLMPSEKFEVYETAFTPLLYSLSNYKKQFYIKALVSQKDNRLLGIHLVGEGTEELIQVLATLICIGATKKQLDETLAVHPSSAEELLTLKKRLR